MNISFNKANYPYWYVTTTKDVEGSPILLYSFRSSRCRARYMVRVECHPHGFYGVKFYLKDHELSPHKYNILTGLNEPRFIVKTIICIMLDIYERNPRASFGFLGAETLVEKETAQATGIDVMTKRMRFYRRMLNTYFSDGGLLLHNIDEAKSTYVLINSLTLAEDPNLLEKINTYFTENYTNFD